MSDRFSLSAATFLAWALAAWCILSGILGIMAWDSDSARFGRKFAEFFGKETSTSALIIAILNIVSGVALLVSSLGVLKPGSAAIAVMLVMAFFAIRGVLALFAEREAFQPNTLAWCRDAGWYLVLVLAVWRTQRPRA